MGALEESYHIEDNEDYNIMGHWGRQTRRFSRRISDVAENASNSRNTFDLRDLWNQAIKDKILSLDYLNYQVEILTADSELSFNNGVIVLVTGILTGKENTGTKFSQVFFLAPQENDYFVLNDVFRFISESVEVDTVANHHIEESAPKAPLMTDPKTTVSVSNQTTSLAKGKMPLSEKRVVDIPKKAEDLPKKSEHLSKKSENVPNKTFASVVQLLKDSSAPFQSRVPPVKPAAPSRQGSMT
nr:putative G3BP-like protein [Quercus suber]